MLRMVLLSLLLSSFILASVSNEVLLKEIKSTNKRLDMLQHNMDKRFEQVDKRLDTMQRNIEVLREDMNRRFEQVDKRFEQVDKRLDQVDRQLDFTHNIMYGIALFVSSVFFLGLFLQDRRTKRFENFIISHEESHKAYINGKEAEYKNRETEYKKIIKEKDQALSKLGEHFNTIKDNYKSILIVLRQQANKDSDLLQELKNVGLM